MTSSTSCSFSYNCNIGNKQTATQTFYAETANKDLYGAMTTDEFISNWICLDYPSPPSFTNYNENFFLSPNSREDEAGSSQNLRTHLSTYTDFAPPAMFTTTQVTPDFFNFSLDTNLPPNDMSLDCMGPIHPDDLAYNSPQFLSQQTPVSMIDPNESRSPETYHNSNGTNDAFLEDKTTTTTVLSQWSSLPESSTINNAVTSSKPRTTRKPSDTRITLPELYERMGLGDDHSEARKREQRILELLRQSGFKLGEQTWVRDTQEADRKKIIEELYTLTYPEYGYSKDLIELIVRRGCYYVMQGRLRKLRKQVRTR